MGLCMEPDSEATGCEPVYSGGSTRHTPQYTQVAQMVERSIVSRRRTLGYTYT